MKNELTANEIQAICTSIANSQYNEIYEKFVYDEKATYISVDEDSDGCHAYWGCLMDNPTSSAPAAHIEYKIQVGKYAFVFSIENKEITYLLTPKDAKYTLPKETELRDKLENCILQAMLTNSDDDYDDDNYHEIDADEQFRIDWSADELVDEIESLLSYDTYIEIDDTIYPVEDSIEDFIEEYQSFDDLSDGEEVDYTELSTREVAERLADEIEFSS